MTSIRKYPIPASLGQTLASRVVLWIVVFCVGEGIVEAADPHPVQIPGVTNAFCATGQILSGSEPRGERTFAALRRMDVAVVVSVDGKKPDIHAAKRQGLRYVHLPVGYDGISPERKAQLAQATRLLEKGEKIFLHCHHGKHRGPAAVAILGRATAAWSAEEAEEWLETAGTAKEYEGLFRAVSDWKPIEEWKVAEASDLPAITETPGVVASMVAMDQHLDALKAIRKEGWQSPHDASNVSAAQMATLLWESFRETARLPETPERPDNYRKMLEEGEAAAKSLRTAIQSGKPSRMNEALALVRRSCVSCHKRYRN